MEEILCPMCGDPNHGEAEECVHCGARLKPLEAGAEAQGSEDWLDRIRSEAGEGASFTDGADNESGPSAPEPGEDSDLDLDRLRAESERPQEPPEKQPSTPPEGGEEVVPEWLQRIRDKQAEQAQAAPQADTPSPEDALRASAAREGGDLPPSMEVEPEDQAGLPPASEPQPGEDTPDWLSDTDEPEAEPEEDLPHVPALIGGEEDAGETGLGDLGLPDWLGEIEPLEEEPAAATPEEGPDLAPATLPNWLEAMRPVDTFRSVVEIESEDDQAVESVGPLAGLSGVLLAEPVVAMPRTSSVGSMQLDVSERQYAQAELLHRLVEEEESEAQPKPKRRARLAIFRWAIAAVVLLAVSLPIVMGTPTFAVPSLEPRELGALFSLVERLPADKPVLVVFDYEPGYAGELEAVSGPFLDHIMARGLPLASMSTRPTGSALAVRAMSRYAERHAYETGQDLVHLGYLSGGPTAVQLFAVNPRDAVLQGFALPEDMQEAGQSAWESPVLSQVHSLSDFGMVTVITADSETARVWAEQARPNMGDSTLVVVLSAGAEPLIRPYFESEDPKVGGILSGLPAAAAYELRNGRLGLAQEHWDAFGTAMLAAELVLLAGIGYGMLIWWRGRSFL